MIFKCNNYCNSNVNEIIKWNSLQFAICLLMNDGDNGMGMKKSNVVSMMNKWHSQWSNQCATRIVLDMEKTPKMFVLYQLSTWTHYLRSFANQFHPYSLAPTSWLLMGLKLTCKSLLIKMMNDMKWN